MINNNNIIIIIIFSYFYVLDIFIFFGDLIFIQMIMRSSRLLHSSMLNSILRNSMHFFESTPLGRIINRFSML
jgi:ABC-type multidrug transport system fused ATPase/permease subunit